MKNKNIITILCIILMISLSFNIYIRNVDKSFDKQISNKTWYNYDINTGNINTFELDLKNNIKTTLLANYSEEKYNYNKAKNIIYIDKNKMKIKIQKGSILAIDYLNKSYNFYDTYEKAINAEFKNYYNKSIIEYKQENIQTLEYLQIKNETIFEKLNSDEYNKIIFQGDNCTSIECTLALEIYKYWMIKNENISMVNSTNLLETDIIKLNSIDNNFLIDKVFYNGIYPRIIIFKNNKIIDTYEIKCSGFNCKKYFENEF